MIGSDSSEWHKQNNSINICWFYRLIYMAWGCSSLEIYSSLLLWFLHALMNRPLAIPMKWSGLPGIQYLHVFFFFLTISFHCGILFLIGLPFHVDHTLILQHFGQRKFYNSTFIPPKNHFHHSMNSGGMEPTRWVHFQNQTLFSVAGDMPMHARHHIPLSI